MRDWQGVGGEGNGESLLMGIVFLSRMKKCSKIMVIVAQL